MQINVNNLKANDYNPNYMDEQEFAELVAEIRHLGRLPKPIIVRPGENGGFVIVDDYGAYEGCRKATDEFMNNRHIRAYLNHVNVDCRYWVKP